MRSIPIKTRFNACLAALLLLLAFVFDVRAAQKGVKAGDEENVVLIGISDEKESFESIIRAVRGQISDLPVGFQVIWIDSMPADFSTQEETARNAAEKTEASAVFWCDLRQTDKMYLYVAVPKLDRVLVRRLDGSGPGGTSETIAIITRASIESMLKDSSSMDENGWETSNKGAQEVETAAPVVKIEAGPVTDETSRFGLEAAYAIDVVSWEHTAVQGLYLALDIHLADIWHLFAGYTFFAAMENRESDVSLVLRRHPFFLGARIIGPLGHTRAEGLIKQVEIGFSAAVSIDYMTEKIREIVNTEDLTLADEGAEVSVSVVPQIYFGLRIISTIKIFACLGADIPLRKIDYLIDDGEGGRLTVFSSWPARPAGRVGLSGGFL